MAQQGDEVLSRAKELIHAGKKEEARNILIKYLKQNPLSEYGWWLMSFAVSHPDQQIQCLEKILQINPDREKVKKKLEDLLGEKTDDEHGGIRTSSTLNGPRLQNKTKKRSAWRWLAPLLIGGLITASLVLYLRHRNNSDPGVVTQLDPTSTQGLPAEQSAALPPTWTSEAPTLSPTPLPTSTDTPTPTGTPTPDPNATRTPLPELWIGTRAGRYPPDFTLKDAVSGKEISIRDYTGQPVLIAFFATWCPYCKSDLPLVQEVYQEYKSQGFVVLGIGVNESETSVRNFGSRYSLNFPIASDANSAVADDYLITGYPYYFFISSTGAIKFVNPGTIQMENLIFHLKKQ